MTASTMSDDTPIAIYRERLLQVRREFRLYPDRVVVRARWLSGRRFQNVIPLESLDPKPQQAMIRQRMYRRTFALALLSAAAAVVLNREGYEAVQPWLIYILYGLFLFFGVVTLLAWPRVRFMRFNNRQAKKPGLDIARAGPDKAGFDAFVEQVGRQIRKA